MSSLWHDQNIINQCPNATSMDLRPLGSGTQKIEEDLNKLFPEGINFKS